MKVFAGGADVSWWKSSSYFGVSDYERILRDIDSANLFIRQLCLRLALDFHWSLDGGRSYDPNIVSIEKAKQSGSIPHIIPHIPHLQTSFRHGDGRVHMFMRERATHSHSSNTSYPPKHSKHAC